LNCTYPFIFFFGEKLLIIFGPGTIFQINYTVDFFQCKADHRNSCQPYFVVLVLLNHIIVILISCQTYTIVLNISHILCSTRIICFYRMKCEGFI